jgi:photosystem II stability/assembly factor-like uncharacterized protein
LKSTLLIFALAGLLTVEADAEWTWQHPLPQGNTLAKVRFSGATDGFAVGDLGTIMVTYDAGASWTLQYEAITDNFRDIHVWDPLTCTIVGDNGTVLRTTDGGTAWVEQNSGTTTGLNAVFFIDSTHAWAGGDQRTMRRTTDAGASWVGQTLPSMMGNPGVNDIFFVTADEGWAVGGNQGGGVIWHTTDAGSVWTLQTSTSASMLAVSFSSGTSGLAVGASGVIYSTTNGGAVWSAVISGTPRGLNDILWATALEVWVAGDNGTLLHSFNGGAAWLNESLPTYASFNGIAIAGPTAVAVGEFGAVARRTNSNPWSFVNSGVHLSANWTSFADPDVGFTVGQGGLILRTSNGGTVWEEITNGGTSNSFYGSEMAGPDNVWIVGDLGVLLHSSNRGSSWTQQSTLTSNTLFSVSFVSLSLGWAVGDLGTLLRTTNGGNSWTTINTGYTDIFFGVKFKDANNGWIVGDNGRILRTVNGGSTWLPQSSGTVNALFYVEFLDLQNGYCAGSGGVILRTTDGGGVWMSAGTGTTTTLYLVRGVSPSSLWAVGDSGLVMHSTNGGGTWAAEFAKTGYDLFGLAVATDSVAWICGDYGTILKTGNAPERVDVTVGFDAEWNLVSNPVGRIPGTSTLLGLYPSASVPYGFGFSPLSGYYQSATLDTGLGYWAKFPVPGSSLITGFPMSSAVVDVFPGWNLVGSLSAAIDTGLVSTNPPGLRSSDWYGYTGGYTPVSQLAPGKGHWVKMSGAGQLLLGGGRQSSVPMMSGVEPVPDPVRIDPESRAWIRGGRGKAGRK